MGDCAIRVSFGDTFDEGISALVRAWCAALAGAEVAGVVECVPAYATVTVSYDPAVLGFRALCGILAGLSRGAAPGPLPSRCLVVPTLYDGEDIVFVAEHTGMTAAQLVSLHSQPAYRVVMIGFLPGFPYLAGLSPALAAPRLAQPRTRVPGGSVGIGGTQTGIYPLTAPGGWRIIGRTPLPLFDASRSPAALLAPGDTVRFVPVDGTSYGALEESIRAGRWAPSWERGE